MGLYGIYVVLNINIFNVEYHAIIEIVESSRLKKNSRVEYVNIEILAHSLQEKSNIKLGFFA